MSGRARHYVIEGLSGQADTDSDQEVTLAELEQFAGKHVLRFVKSELNEKQTPERRGESRGLVTLARSSPKSWDYTAGFRVACE